MNKYIKKITCLIITILFFVPCCSSDDDEYLYKIIVTCEEKFSGYYIVDGGSVLDFPSSGSISDDNHSIEVDEIEATEIIEIRAIIKEDSGKATMNLMIYKDGDKVADSEFNYDGEDDTSRTHDFEYTVLGDEIDSETEPTEDTTSTE